MREQQDTTKPTQNPSPPSLGRKYIRRLLEAFEPHQDDMLADLDRQIEESNPAIVSLKSDELSNQLQKKMKQLEPREKTGSGTVEATLIALLDEIIALNGTQMTLWDQLRSTTRQSNVLKYKRAHLVELLQAIHTIRQEGNWENRGEKEKYPTEFALLGERFLIFSSTKQKLRQRTIEDIDEWMKQQQIDVVPAPEEQTNSTEETAKPTPRKRIAAKKQPMPSASPAQTYERQAWIRLLVSARHSTATFKIIWANWVFSSTMRLRASHEPCSICGQMERNSNFLL